MVNILDQLEGREKKGKDREGDRSKKKRKRSHHHGEVGTTKEADQTVTIAVKGEGSGQPELQKDLIPPTPVDIAAETAVPEKTGLEATRQGAITVDSFGVEITPSGVVHLNITERDDAVNSPKPSGLLESGEIVTVEDSPVKPQQADLESAKKRKRAESTTERLLKKAEGLRRRSRAASKRISSGALQKKADEKETFGEMATPPIKPRDLPSSSVNSLTMSDIIRDVDALQQRDKLLDSPPDEVANKKSELAAEDSTIAAMRLMKVKAEKTMELLSKPPPPPFNPLISGKAVVNYCPVRFFKMKPRKKSNDLLLNPPSSFFLPAAQSFITKRRQNERLWKEQRRRMDPEQAKRPINLTSRANIPSLVIAANGSEPAMKPGDLEGALPPLVSLAPKSSVDLSIGREGEPAGQTVSLEGSLPPPPLSCPSTLENEILKKMMSDLEVLKTQYKDMEDREKAARAREEAARTILEAERRDRSEKEKAYQEQISALSARLEKGRKDFRRLEDDCSYYRNKLVHQSREAGGSRHPLNVADDGRRASSRQVAGTSSTFPGGRAPDIANEAVVAPTVRMIPAARVERDAARLHSIINNLHRGINQLQSTVLQVGDHVARLHREDAPSDPHPG